MIEAVTIKNFTNSAGDLVLTLADPESSQGFAIVDMDGLGPVQASYTSNDWVTIDGSKLSSMRMSKREINMELRFIPTNNAESIAQIRQKSYLFFPVKNKIGLTFTCVNDFSKTNMKEQYYIEGYVTKNEPAMWTSESGCEITIVCPDPYFSNVDHIEDVFTQSEPKMVFEFPQDGMELSEGSQGIINYPVSEKLKYVTKELYNPSSIPVGVQFTLTAKSKVKNPRIYNETTYELFSLNHTMNGGETILIDTRVGHKSISLKEGLGKNYIGKMNLNSQWIQLRPGSNIIGMEADSGMEYLQIEYKIIPLYIGI